MGIKSISLIAPKLKKNLELNFLVFFISTSKINLPVKILNRHAVISDVNRHVWIRKFTNTLCENLRDAADCRPEQT